MTLQEARDPLLLCYIGDLGKVGAAAVRGAYQAELALGWLVANASTPPPAPIDESKVEPGVIGLLFFLASVIAVGLLGWSMIRRMRRLDVARRPGGWAAPPPAVDLPVDDELQAAGATSAADPPRHAGPT